MIYRCLIVFSYLNGNSFKQKKEICQNTIFATKNIQTFYDRRNIDQLALYNIYCFRVDW